MPTRSFEYRKSISLGDFSGGVGSGPEKHAPIGTNSEGKRFRFLVRFQHDFSGVEVLNKATLKLRGTGSNNHIQKSSGTIRVARLNSSFADNGGSEGLWVTNAGTVWPGPGWGNAQTFSITPANDRDHELDITNIVKDWLNGTASNYGLMIDDNGGNLQAEFGSGRASNAPTLVIDYQSATKPTVEFLFPTDENHVPVYYAEFASTDKPEVGLHWDYTLGVTDTALTVHEFDVVRVSDSAVVASGDFMGPSLPVVPRVRLALDAGETYDLVVRIAGNGGAGTASYTKRFTVPWAEAIYAVPLGIEPEAVGVSKTDAEGSRDEAILHYAKSITADAAGIEGDWQDTVPNAFTDATFYYLLVRARLVRTEAAYIPVDPDGIDRIRVSWRSKS